MINFRISTLSCASIAGAMIVLFAGCASVDNEHTYTLLGRTMAQAAGTTISPAGPSVAIAPVTVPEAVDRRELVIRSGANRVTVMENHRWAESLKNAIPRVIADDLSQLLGGAPVSLQSENLSRDAKYVLLIDVTRFDSTLHEAATIDITWSVRLADGSRLRSGQSSVSVPVQGGGYDELVAAHTQVLGKLSEEIAAQLKTLATTPGH